MQSLNLLISASFRFQLRMRLMGKNGVALLLIFMVLFGCFSSASAAPPASEISLQVFSISGRPIMKFESGYTVETVFDGSKLGIEPYSVEVSPSGELLVLDSANSNIYKISAPLSLYSRPKLVAGSPEGYSGHVDGKSREARMNHPKGLTVDDGGNIYIADTMNMAIRKISDAGVTTIAGGKWDRGGGHVDGPSEDAKFSNDFDVVYVGSSCSLLVIDRGSQAIREIQLHFDDCAYQYASGFPLGKPTVRLLSLSSFVVNLRDLEYIYSVIAGVVILVTSSFFGYMLALLQRRVGSMVSSQNDPRTLSKTSIASSSYQKPLNLSVRPPLIPTDDDPEKQEEGFFSSLGRLFLNTGASVAEIFGGLFSGFRKKPLNSQHQQMYQQQSRHPNDWPLQESFVIPDGDEPPSIETRTPTPRKTYAFMAKDPEKTHHFRQSRAFYSEWDGDHQQQKQQQQHHQRHYSSGPQTYYEQNRETTNEVVFGAVQEQNEQRETVVIKAVDYGDPIYNHHNILPQNNYMGYSHGH
ncbi:hypothetical protein HHK36_015151 [Tetracentron sinense]|uniref:NHL repeat-containing protein n=1 Tax=Tetracentron sinense TaxID=13715 RepID=A0A835DDK9_TETSI|nr:hypothetical protein HHK36_015151 [Tetracentron sinense]